VAGRGMEQTFRPRIIMPWLSILCNYYVVAYPTSELVLSGSERGGGKVQSTLRGTRRDSWFKH
jgi:hypothetical protein